MAFRLCAGTRDPLDRRQLIFSFLTLTTGPSLVSPHIAAASQFADSRLLFSSLLNTCPAFAHFYISQVFFFQFQCQLLGENIMARPRCDILTTLKLFLDLRMGNGPNPNTRDIVVEVDWAWGGYTVGCYGRIFEARNKTNGGYFEGALNEYRSTTSSGPTTAIAITEGFTDFHASA